MVKRNSRFIMSFRIKESDAPFLSPMMREKSVLGNILPRSMPMICSDMTPKTPWALSFA